MFFLLSAIHDLKHCTADSSLAEAIAHATAELALTDHMTSGLKVLFCCRAEMNPACHVHRVPPPSKTRCFMSVSIVATGNPSRHTKLAATLSNLSKMPTRFDTFVSELAALFRIATSLASWVLTSVSLELASRTACVPSLNCAERRFSRRPRSLLPSTRKEDCCASENLPSAEKAKHRLIMAASVVVSTVIVAISISMDQEFDLGSNILYLCGPLVERGIERGKGAWPGIFRRIGKVHERHVGFHHGSNHAGRSRAYTGRGFISGSFDFRKPSCTLFNVQAAAVRIVGLNQCGQLLLCPSHDLQR